MPRPFGAHCDIGAYEAQNIRVVTNTVDGAPGSLRQVVLDAANADTIIFSPDVFRINKTLYLGEFGQIEISKSLTIDGTAGRVGWIYITGDNIYFHRLFQVDAGASVTLIGMQLGGESCLCNGVSIYNSGILTIVQSGFSWSHAWSQPWGGQPGYGGAIYNAGILFVISGWFYENAAMYGNAIYNQLGSSVHISDSYFSRGGDGQGANILNDGIATVDRSIFVNEATGIENHAILSVIASAFFSNTADRGSAIVNGDDTGAGIAIVSESTFMGNRSSEGGAIFNNAALNLSNSTLTGNAPSYGVDGLGGAILNSYSGTLNLVNNTIAGNWASLGGGIYNSGTLTLTNTIVADSSSGANCAGIEGGIMDGGHNLEDADTCHFGAGGSLTNTNPRLGSAPNILLYINPLRVPTLALLPGSPAIDAGDDSVCPATDERGVQRPFGLHCDIGAFEATFITRKLRLIIVMR